jgi:hypothetical protein
MVMLKGVKNGEGGGREPFNQGSGNGWGKASCDITMWTEVQIFIYYVTFIKYYDMCFLIVTDKKMLEEIIKKGDNWQTEIKM